MYTLKCEVWKHLLYIILLQSAAQSYTFYTVTKDQLSAYLGDLLSLEDLKSVGIVFLVVVVVVLRAS